MRKVKLIIGLVFFSNLAVSGQDIISKSVAEVYQRDIDATQFEFSTGEDNGCGGRRYLVTSPNEAVANRKFSIILTAFTANKKIAFHDLESCTSNRAVVSWVRFDQ